ncbi:MAG: hypothetical protein HY925_11215 [Elusimicrobia bacterium]|nr:hypothetical protein [Elusimicrobiota bacterium]
MNAILALLLAVLPLAQAHAAAFAAKRAVRRGNPRGLGLPQGASGLNFSRGISNSRVTAGAGLALQFSQAGTPEAFGLVAAVGASNSAAASAQSGAALKNLNGSGGTKPAGESVTPTGKSETVEALEPEAADAPAGDCHGADYKPFDCHVPEQPSNIPALTAAEQAECEAQAASMPFFLGAQCSPVAWWLQHHFTQPGGEWDLANSACREQVHASWRTRHTYDNCPNNYGTNQRRYIEGPAGHVSTHEFRTQAAEEHPENHVNEFVWAVRPILSPRNIDVWVSAEPNGEPVEGKACRQHDVFIFAGDIRYLIVDPAKPLSAAHQKQVELGMYCVLRPGKRYYFNFKIEQCEGAACGVVSELYLH